ncbi:unnamed protein product [Effrenium voratum]|nr:unnamed protein product [Effrenium voratum]
MPPGALPVKSVGEGFGKERGVRAGDVLLQVGKDELASLEGMSADSFKNLLKERPLRMQFQSGGGSLSEPSTPAITPRKLEAQQAAEHPREAAEHTAEVPAVASGVPAAEPAAAAAIPAVQAAGSERAEGSTYEILADASVSKMGIAFRGMPPGALPVKSVGEGFGKEHGVRAGDVLLQVGKDELASLEGMSADSFKNLLKERPLRMQFQSGGGSLSEPSTPAITPRTLEAQQAAEAVVSGAMPAAEPRAVPPAEDEAKVEKGEQETSTDASLREVAGTQAGTQPQQPSAAEVREPTSETTAVSVGADPKETAAGMAEPQPSLPSDVPDKQVTGTKSEPQHGGTNE